MGFTVNQIAAPVSADKREVIEKARRLCGISPDKIKSADIHKTSLDARKRSNIHFVHSVYFELADPAEEQRLCAKKGFCRIAEEPAQPNFSDKKREGRTVVAGFGPAGMFCALTLARCGYRPLVLEKGAEVDKRTQKVEAFWAGGELDENSNVQFGEGGAGTFSDGKLTTRIKDPLCRSILQDFARFGADSSILAKAKPHIGTDVLKTVVKNIRREIIALGGEICFETPLTGITMRGGEIWSVKSARGEERCAALVVACGHSARETFHLLDNSGIIMQPKPFSVGVRIEHRQTAVNESLYGVHAGNPLLPVGEYQLSHRNAEGRGVYTFCMCPGGTVVNAASEEGGIVVNGMSEYGRDAENSNSALLVGIEPENFGSDHPLAGMDMQRKIEHAAFLAGGSDYTAPAQLVGDFLADRPSTRLGAVHPSCPTGVVMSDLRKILPKKVTDTYADALLKMDKMLKGFAMPEAVFTAPETRSSSPVRILRDEIYQSNIRGLYPCGEGAGYAGGIVSAGVDGVRCAYAVLADENDEW